MKQMERFLVGLIVCAIAFLFGAITWGVYSFFINIYTWHSIGAVFIVIVVIIYFIGMLVNEGHE